MSYDGGFFHFNAREGLFLFSYDGVTMGMGIIPKKL